MLVFVERKKAEQPGEKPLEQGQNQQQTEPTYDTGLELNLPGATLMGGDHHSTIPAPHGLGPRLLKGH